MQINRNIKMKQHKRIQQLRCLSIFDQIKMDIQQQNNLSEIRKTTDIQEQSPIHRQDLFQQLFIQQYQNHQIIQQQPILQPIINKSKKRLLKTNDFRKILNSSSSNERLIPSQMKYQSSRQNSQKDKQIIDAQNSFDSQSFRKSFKKRVDQSFSVQNTIRDSSSSFSQRSQRSYASFLPSSVYKQQDDMRSQKKIGCNCKRSKCLKLYCQCFQKKIFCNQDCRCYDCGNHKQNIAEHKQAIIEALARNAHGFDAFDDEPQKKQNPQQKNLTFSLGFEIQQVKKGCKCRKTHCVKKYCECYQNRIPCGVFCKCQDCHNTSDHRQTNFRQNNFKQINQKQHNRQNNHFMYHINHVNHSNRQNLQMKKFI